MDDTRDITALYPHLLPPPSFSGGCDSSFLPSSFSGGCDSPSPSASSSFPNAPPIHRHLLRCFSSSSASNSGVDLAIGVQSSDFTVDILIVLLDLETSKFKSQSVLVVNLQTSIDRHGHTGTELAAFITRWLSFYGFRFNSFSPRWQNASWLTELIIFWDSSGFGSFMIMQRQVSLENSDHLSFSVRKIWFFLDGYCFSFLKEYKKLHYEGMFLLLLEGKVLTSSKRSGCHSRIRCKSLDVMHKLNLVMAPMFKALKLQLLLILRQMNLLFIVQP